MCAKWGKCFCLSGLQFGWMIVSRTWMLTNGGSHCGQLSIVPYSISAASTLPHASATIGAKSFRQNIKYTSKINRNGSIPVHWTEKINKAMTERFSCVPHKMKHNTEYESEKKHGNTIWLWFLGTFFGSIIF